MPLHYGQIVIVSEMTDPNGVNPKDRPSVVVTPTNEIDPEGSIIVVAISTLLPGSAPDDCVELPWDPRRHPRTGLRTRCAAVIPWIQEVPIDRIIGSIGIVPGKQLVAIAAKLADLRG
jgi:PemK-like, MazF-like toxin of type II toxin-antitoxin system